MDRFLRPTLAILNRDLRLKYHSKTGVLFALLRPWITVFVLHLVFSRLTSGSFKSFDHLSIFAGVVVWNLFSGVFSEGGGSLVANPTLIHRVNFPFSSLPLASLFLFWIESSILLLTWSALLFFNDRLHLQGLLWGCVFILHATILIGGLTCIASVLNYRFRNLRYVWPLVLQLGFLLTPIGYPLELFPESSIMYFHLNPLVGLIEGLRGVDFSDSVDLQFVASSWLWSAVIGIGAVGTMLWYERAGRY